MNIESLTIYLDKTLKQRKANNYTGKFTVEVTFNEGGIRSAKQIEYREIKDNRNIYGAKTKINIE